MWYYVCLAHCPQGCYNGKCDSPNTCTCDMGWSGLNCTKGIVIQNMVHAAQM